MDAEFLELDFEEEGSGTGGYAKVMSEEFIKAEMPDLLRVELCVRPDASGRGMTGSGMLIINPPYTLAQHMAQAMPLLKEHLCDTGGHGMVKRLTGEGA